MHTLLISAIATLICTMAQATPMTIVMQSFPPFAINNNGIAEGMFPQVIDAVCASIRVECVQRIYPWRRALRMAETGEADGIAAIQRLPEREAFMTVSEPVVSSSYAVFTLVDSNLVFRQSSDLEGYTVGAYGPSATSRVAEELVAPARDTLLMLEIDNQTVLRKLSAQRYRPPAAVVLTAEVGTYLIKQENLNNIRIAGEIKRIEYSIGLSKKSNPLQTQQFLNALHELMRNGTIHSIIARHGLTPPAYAGVAQGRRTQTAR